MERLDVILKGRGLNQTEAAELFGVSQVTVSNWLLRGVPVHKREFVAARLGVTVEELIGSKHSKRAVVVREEGAVYRAEAAALGAGAPGRRRQRGLQGLGRR